MSLLNGQSRPAKALASGAAMWISVLPPQPAKSAMNPLRRALFVAIAFLVVAIAVSVIRPLWIDEIMQLTDTRQHSVQAVLTRVAHNPGGVPLAYLLQHTLFAICGYSVCLARMPSAVFGAAAVFVVALLGAELGLRHAWLGAAIFGIFPLTLRYAAESRGYAQALFLSVVATLLYLRLTRRPSRRLMGTYWLALTAAAYTQPYSASVGLAHILWSACARDRASVRRGTACQFLSALSFLPWYAWSGAGSAASVRDGGFHFVASVHTPLMIFRELAGAGYWGSALLLVLCAAAAANRLPARQASRLLGLLIIAPVAFGLAADAWFGYFIAARQFLWVLPAVAILAATAAERRRRATAAIIVLLAVVCLWQNVRFFSTPSEDWQAAANVLAEETARGACLRVAPADHAQFYEFFRPELRGAHCTAPRLILAISPYATADLSRAAVTGLFRDGYKQDQDEWIGKSHIVQFHR